MIYTCSIRHAIPMLRLLSYGKVHYRLSTIVSNDAMQLPLRFAPSATLRDLAREAYSRERGIKHVNWINKVSELIPNRTKLILSDRLVRVHPVRTASLIIPL